MQNMHRPLCWWYQCKCVLYLLQIHAHMLWQDHWWFQSSHACQREIGRRVQGWHLKSEEREDLGPKNRADRQHPSDSISLSLGSLDSSSRSMCWSFAGAPEGIETSFRTQISELLRYCSQNLWYRYRYQSKLRDRYKLRYRSDLRYRSKKLQYRIRYRRNHRRKNCDIGYPI